MTAFYIVVGVVLYTYANPFIASPALGTAGVLVKRISYGIALPGLFFTAIIYNHLAAKFIFVRVLRGSHHLNHPTAKHWAVWLSCTGACLLFSYVVAEAIPVFSGLVGLVSALFGTMMALHAEVRPLFPSSLRPLPPLLSAHFVDRLAPLAGAYLSLRTSLTLTSSSLRAGSHVPVRHVGRLQGQGAPHAAHVVRHLLQRRHPRHRDGRHGRWHVRQCVRLSFLARLVPSLAPLFSPPSFLPLSTSPSRHAS